MPAPNEETQQLPSDGGGRFFAGLWDEARGLFVAPRADAARNQRVALYNAAGEVLLTAARPGVVSLAAGTALIGRTRPEYDTPLVWVNASITTPAANQIIVDTGPVATAGKYRVEIEMAYTATAGVSKLLYLLHRDATNTITHRTLVVPAPTSWAQVWTAVPLAQNERIVVSNSGLAGDVNSTASATIRLYLLPS